MQNIDWDKYGIGCLYAPVSYRRNSYQWSCFAFGHLIYTDTRYKTADGATAACKRWIRKHGVKP